MASDDAKKLNEAHRRYREALGTRQSAARYLELRALVEQVKAAHA